MSTAISHVNTTVKRTVTENLPSSPLASPVSAHDHHSHAGGICPRRGADHSYCPPQPTDMRSPCPALNTLANHGFLPRNGRNIGPITIFWALVEGYQLSVYLAAFISFGGWFLLGQLRKLSLWDLSRHNCIEHDASLFHIDAHREDEYAPVPSNKSLTKASLHQGGQYRRGRMTLQDVANIRVKRESALVRPLKWWQAEIARGEMALAIAVLGGKNADEQGLDLEVLHLWVTQERLPDNWKPDHTQGLVKTAKMTKVVRDRMNAMVKGVMPNILDNDPSLAISPAETVTSNR